MQGNLIGTAGDGMTALPNGCGLLFEGTGGMVGGPGPFEGNVISGNRTFGIMRAAPRPGARRWRSSATRSVSPPTA